MISDQSSQSSNNNVESPVRGLTVEESFFLELLQKKEKPVINLKFTPKGAQVGNIDLFSNYYSEAEIIRLLESLVSKKALIKQEKGTVLLCPKCGGHAGMAVLVCPRCGSTKVGRKEDLNHVECEYWGPREEYVDGVLLRCPRCDGLLDERALEGTSGYFSISDPYFECQDCGTNVSKNNLTMVCIKCSNKYTTVQASYLNSVSYVLAQGVSVKPQAEPPKSIQQRMKEKYQPEKIEKKPDPESKLEPQHTDVEEVVEEKSGKIGETIEKSPELVGEPEPEREHLDVLPEPISEPEPEPEPIVESTLHERPEPKLESESERRVEPVPDEDESEQEPEPSPKKKKKRRKKKKTPVLQNPMNRLSEMLKKKPKKKPVKKKKSIKKASKKKPIPEPISEPEFEVETPEPVVQEPEKERLEPEPVEEEAEPIEKAEQMEEEAELIDKVELLEEEVELLDKEYQLEEEWDLEEITFEDTPNRQNSFYEETPQPKVPEKDDSLHILMVVENATVSEFVIESLEKVRKPISVLHVEDGPMALKELKQKYNVLILDFELKSIESKFILSEMEKWGIMTPIIILSDMDPKLDKYILNIEAVLKKKQRSIYKIAGIIRKLI